MEVTLEQVIFWSERILILIFELFVYYVGFSNLFEKRKMNKLWHIILIAVLAEAFFMIGCIDFCLIKILLSFVIVTALMYAVFRAGAIYILGVTGLIFSLKIVWDFLLLTIFRYDYDIFTLVTNNFDDIFIIRVVSKMILFGMVVYLTKRLGAEHKISFNHWSKFVLISLLSTIGLTIYVIPEDLKFFPTKLVLPVFVVVLNVLVYYNLSDIVNLYQKLKFKAINGERIESELKLWEKIKANDDLQRKMLHDYSNTMLCIKGLLEKEEFDEAKKYVSNLSLDLTVQGKFVATGNPLVDVLLNAKYVLAKEKGIVMNLNLDSLKECRIKSKDLIIILGNLLDNAIEHCELLSAENKRITLIIQNSDKFKLLITNPIKSAVYVKNNLIKSSKKTKNHGIGLYNVKAVVQGEYKGKIFIEVKEKFEYMIII